MQFGVKYRICIGVQLTPFGYGSIEVSSLRSKFAATNVFKSSLIGGNQTTASTHFDAHVTDGHAPFHAQVAESRTCVFYKIPGAPTGSDLGNDVQDNVLGTYARPQLTIYGDAHALCFALHQALSGQHHLNFGSSNPKSHTAKSAVGRGMAVSAYNGHPGLGNAQLGANYVYYPLVGVVEAIKGNPVFFAVFGQLVHLETGKLVANWLILINGRHIVVRSCHSTVGAEHFESACI